MRANCPGASLWICRGFFYARWINHDAIDNPAFTDRAAIISKYTSNFGAPR